MKIAYPIVVVLITFESTLPLSGLQFGYQLFGQGNRIPVVPLSNSAYKEPRYQTESSLSDQRDDDVFDMLDPDALSFPEDYLSSNFDDSFLFPPEQESSQKALPSSININTPLYNLLLPSDSLSYAYPTEELVESFGGSSIGDDDVSYYAKRDDIETDGIKVTPVYPINKFSKYKNTIDEGEERRTPYYSRRIIKRDLTNKRNEPKKGMLLDQGLMLQTQNDSDKDMTSINVQSKPESTDVEKDSQMLQSETLPVVEKRPSGEEEHCVLDTVMMNMRFREYIDSAEGPLLLTCTGSVEVNKCEGLCNSLVQPDVNAYDGFGRVSYFDFSITF